MCTAISGGGKFTTRITSPKDGCHCKRNPRAGRRSLRIQGTSRDVIHSFWAPNMQGKRDLMPGYDTEVMMQIDQPGRWRGQCAEYCGEQHAHMSFYMVAESGSVRQWLYQQARAASARNTSDVHGQQVFLTHACVMCHTIRGTPAGSRVGPDLTHLASRATIAAGALPEYRSEISAAGS